MGTQNIFERQEIKYLITYQQRIRLEGLVERYMEPDPFGKSTIGSLYYDTPNRQLIRHSLEKPIYKEKLRIRSYGNATPESTVYVELKKKFKGTVYKRRVSMSQKESKNWLEAGILPQKQSQISEEIAYFLQQYPLVASMLIFCRREAFFAKDESDFRMTFDENILWRDYDMCLCNGVYGEEILSKGMQLLEVKSPLGIPLWLTKFFSENQIFKVNYSKYGNGYTALCRKQKRGGILIA